MLKHLMLKMKIKVKTSDVFPDRSQKNTNLFGLRLNI